MMALVPVANPSMPSVRLAPLETAVTMKVTMSAKTAKRNQGRSVAQSVSRA